MPRCTRNSCGQNYEEATNDPISCQYHPGKPEFHEGLKGWTCCKPRVHSFDDFMEIKGCKLGFHSSEAKHKDDPFKADLTKYDDVLPEPQGPVDAKAAARGPGGSTQLAASTPEPEPIDEDPDGVQIPAGAKCKRNGCSAVYVSDDESRRDGQCQFHPGKALFHEGNKGWTCCKPRATEFDEFLRIKGCKTGRHLFVGTQPEKKTPVDKCRHDYYQSGSNVIVSIYAKKIDRESSWIKFSPETLQVHLVYGDGKVYDDEFKLFAEIDPAKSSFEFLSTKAELSLAKQTAATWPELGRSTAD
ncbi:hypothetical protein H4R99_000743 [Coemansia sp. RSA 1722]|nr:hypothetical protein LPJ57_000093 [Coemansia sp. RSA 486]KAJ2237822.1 hypothetical protein IWW45_000563 [Coemansia sp. RSA 485]KAJ2603250.1 hypothetical protein GGF39_000202 [Coemansia sp. RSA 1721]KAJ2605879.1 hypothetical protein H4R99_000743 [Coemansia sp. RSA 1722]KAJ2639960.1 hypothetical protein GGF40_000489 [Coemansia sp. RSA 1286]